MACYFCNKHWCFYKIDAQYVCLTQVINCLFQQKQVIAAVLKLDKIYICKRGSLTEVLNTLRSEFNLYFAYLCYCLELLENSTWLWAFFHLPVFAYMFLYLCISCVVGIYYGEACQDIYHDRHGSVSLP